MGALALAGVAIVGLLVNRALDAAMTAVAPVTATEQPIILMGLHGRTSDPFFLGGGSYRGTWSAWGEAPNEPPCMHEVELVAVDRADPTGSIPLTQRVDVPYTGASGEVDMPRLEPGDYYLQVTSACAWQIELSRV